MSDVSCWNLGGGHPTCFLHWDIFKKKKKDKQTNKQTVASRSVERGELCLCLMSMHLWQEEAHHTDFLWHQRVTWSLISVQFHPIHKPPLVWMQRPSAVSACSAPLLSAPDSAQGWGVFFFLCLFTTLASRVWAEILITLLLWSNTLCENMYVCFCWCLKWWTCDPVEFNRQVTPLMGLISTGYHKPLGQRHLVSTRCCHRRSSCLYTLNRFSLGVWRQNT